MKKSYESETEICICSQDKCNKNRDAFRTTTTTTTKLSKTTTKGDDDDADACDDYYCQYTRTTNDATNLFSIQVHLTNVTMVIAITLYL